MRYKQKSYKTPNWHGLNNEAKKMNIADDFIKYNLTVKMIQETKICDNLMHKIKSQTEMILHLYNSGHRDSDAEIQCNVFAA